MEDTHAVSVTQSCDPSMMAYNQYGRETLLEEKNAQRREPRLLPHAAGVTVSDL